MGSLKRPGAQPVFSGSGGQRDACWGGERPGTMIRTTLRSSSGTGTLSDTHAWLTTARNWVAHRSQIAGVFLLLVDSARELRRGDPTTAAAHADTALNRAHGLRPPALVAELSATQCRAVASPNSDTSRRAGRLKRAFTRSGANSLAARAHLLDLTPARQPHRPPRNDLLLRGNSPRRVTSPGRR